MSDFDHDEASESFEENVAIAKAHFIGRDVPASNVKEEEGKRDGDIFQNAGAILVPYDPALMCKLFEHSNSLRPNIDAYAVNIEGNGHRFEPVIDLEADDAIDKVGDAMYLETLIELDTGEDDPEAQDLDEDGNPKLPEFPKKAEIKKRMKAIEIEMRLERAKLDAFFRYCSLDESFLDLRMKTRTDLEIMGNAYWEILRNAAGEPAQFNYVQGFTVRLLPVDAQPVEVMRKIKRAPLNYEEVAGRKKFRRYVQVFGGSKVYYKEFGDPRVVSSRTGKAYEDAKALQVAEDPDKKDPVPEATELLHFKIHSPRSPYGVPRWIGTLLAVLGSRQSEEVNFLYFENKSVPPLAVLVSGGRLAKDSVTKLEKFIEERIQGRNNFHKIMVIEAIPSSTDALDNAGGRMKIEIVPLTGAQHNDALFQNYDERNIDKVGMSFRLPRLLRGDIRDFNRATAEAALEYAEIQVFSPERESFDWMINRKVLTDIGIRYWLFASNSPTTRNPLDLAQIIVDVVKASILTPEEARELLKAVFNRDFKKLDEIWAKFPPELLKAAVIATKDGSILDIPGLEPPPPPAETAPAQQTPPGGAQGAQGAPGENQPPDPNAPEGKGAKEPKKGVVKSFLESIPPRRDIRLLARDLVALRDSLRAGESAAAREDFEKRAEEEMDREVIQIPEDEFRALLGK